MPKPKAVLQVAGVDTDITLFPLVSTPIFNELLYLVPEIYLFVSIYPPQPIVAELVKAYTLAFFSYR